MTHQERRIKLAKEFVPEIFDGTLSGPLLYVGAMPKRIQLVPELHEEFKIVLLEVIPAFANHYAENPLFTKIIQGDVRKLDSYLPADFSFNVSIWWHGPEHIPKSEFIPTVQAIERRTVDLVVLASPFGETKANQDHADHLELNHISALLPRDYRRLGYKIVFLGNQAAAAHGRNTHIMGWKWLRPKSA